MKKFLLVLKSRTVWSAVALFLVGGVSAISDIVPDAIETPLMMILTGMVAYFKVTPSQKY